VLLWFGFSFLSFLRFFRKRLEITKRFIPETVQVIADRGNPFALLLIHTTGPIFVHGHQFCFTKYLQMLGHGRPGDGKALGNMDDR